MRVRKKGEGKGGDYRQTEGFKLVPPKKAHIFLSITTQEKIGILSGERKEKRKVAVPGGGKDQVSLIGGGSSLINMWSYEQRFRPKKNLAARGDIIILQTPAEAILFSLIGKGLGSGGGYGEGGGGAGVGADGLLYFLVKWGEPSSERGGSQTLGACAGGKVR